MKIADELLDWEQDEILTFSFGYMFPPPMRYAGFAILVIGVISSFGAIWSLPITGLVGGWMSFRKSGVQIKPSNRLRREYTSFLVKHGKWFSYEDYPCLAILKGREGYAAYSRAMVEQRVTEEVYDLYLLSKDHRKRLIVTRFKDEADADEKGPDLAEKLGLTWTVYNPVVSEKTRQRRR